MKIYKILGKRCRITIPYDIRMRYGYTHNDVVSFEEKDDCIIVRREKICDKCNPTKNNSTSSNEKDFLNFADKLPSYDQQVLLEHLLSKLKCDTLE